ncbi:CoA-binding protein [uncultured Spongiibacter sp.]|uniref:CoA-binding protein n=1 Tax=uncultured Spongiibacter sp. TaxID=870896 RepID=UPI002589B956|nr:CoA-binding protein [uncultured Spongiibacter sp.]
MAERVVVLGASPKPERYSNKAARMLIEYGHTVVPVNPYHRSVAGIHCQPDIASVAGPVDTVTVYMRGELLAPHMDALLSLAPKRVIFNPGSEDEGLASELRARGIVCEHACTLVLLRSKQF